MGLKLQTGWEPLLDHLCKPGGDWCVFGSGSHGDQQISLDATFTPREQTARQLQKHHRDPACVVSVRVCVFGTLIGRTFCQSQSKKGGHTWLHRPDWQAQGTNHRARRASDQLENDSPAFCRWTSAFQTIFFLYISDFFFPFHPSSLPPSTWCYVHSRRPCIWSLRRKNRWRVSGGRREMLPWTQL